MDRRAGFEAVFLDFGQAVQQRWADAALTVAFEDLQPVSAFPVPPGRRWGPGLWWSATTGGHVVAGSNAMRAQLTVLDRDPLVSGLAGRPVRLLWRDGRGQVRSWVPQLFARYTDGTGLLADCPSHADGGGERALRAGAVVAAACEEIGWRYRRLLPLEPVLAGNLKWLAGYRHPRYQGPPGLMEAVLAAFDPPQPMIDAVAAVGNPLTVLPAIYHALWQGWLKVPLDRPLSQGAVLTPGRRAPTRPAAGGSAAGPDAGGAGSASTWAGRADAAGRSAADGRANGVGRSAADGRPVGGDVAGDGTGTVGVETSGGGVR